MCGGPTWARLQSSLSDGGPNKHLSLTVSLPHQFKPHVSPDHIKRGILALMMLGHMMPLFWLLSCWYLWNIWSQCMYFHQWCSPHRCERPATFEECHLNRILWWSSAAAQAAPTPHSHPLIRLAALFREQVDDHDHPDHDHDHRVTDDWIQDVSVPFLWWQIS